MPKVSKEHMEERRNEIINACEKIYKEKGFYGVTLKEIGNETSFTRPAMYTYFETKDEILLALLEREYEAWCDSLETVRKSTAKKSRKKLAEAIAHTLDSRETLLRIQNMNLFEIEQNSRVECLAEFKKVYKRTLGIMMDILKAYKPDMKDKERETISLTFFSFLFGVYPFVFHTEKQLQAMEIADVRQSEVTIFDMVYELLIRIIPEIK